MLTAKQAAFCNAVALENQSLTDAYRAVYDTSKCKPETVHRSATQLAKSPTIAARIAELRGKVEATAVKAAAYTLEHAMGEAGDVLERAKAAGQVGAAVSAVTLRAKLAGHLMEKIRVQAGPLDESDVKELIALRDELRARRDAERRAAGETPIDTREGNRPVQRQVTH